MRGTNAPLYYTQPIDIIIHPPLIFTAGIQEFDLTFPWRSHRMNIE